MKLTAQFVNESAAKRDRTARTTSARGLSHAARNLALAYRIDQLIERGLIADFTAAAKLLGVSQPRLSHLMGLLLLAPTIQEAILVGTIAPGDKQLRRLSRLPAWNAQLEAL